MKKILALVLAIVLVVGMVACASNKTTTSATSSTAETASASTSTTSTSASASTSAAASSAAASASTSAAASSVIKKVALVTDVGTIDDESFNQATWQGVKEYCENNNVEYTYYQPTDDSNDARCISIDQAISEGANVVVMPGYLFGAAVLTEQDKYPDVYFLAIDVGSGDLTLDYKTFSQPSANTTCITFAEEQAGYLAGYSIVEDGYTKLGFLGGMAVPAVIRYGYGYLQGARDAAKAMGVDVSVNYTYGGQFFGDDTITAKMEGWYSNGTQVVFACGGGIYTSAVEAANMYKGKVIGVDVDQSSIDPCIITSAFKGLQPTVVTALTGLANGEWETTYGGKFLNMDLSQGDYVGLPTSDTAWRFATWTVDQYTAVKNDIMSGKITIDNNSDNAQPTVDGITVNYVD